MTWTKHDYEDIPGTYVFDGKHAYGAYPLNKLLFSFCDEANRSEFDRDPAAYCDKYGVKTALFLFLNKIRNLMIECNFYTHPLNASYFIIQLITRQTVGRNAKMQHTARYRTRLVNLYFVSQPRQMVSCR